MKTRYYGLRVIHKDPFHKECLCGLNIYNKLANSYRLAKNILEVGHSTENQALSMAGSGEQNYELE